MMKDSRMTTFHALNAGPSVFHQHRSVGWRPSPLLPEGEEHDDGDGDDGEGEAPPVPTKRAAAKQGAGGQPGAKSFADMSSAEKAAHYGYPLNTRVADMTPVQQAGYHRAQSEKAQARLKAFDGLTPEALESLRERAERADALDLELATDTERAVREAEERAQKDADARWGARVAAAAVRAELKTRGITDNDDIAEILDNITLSNLLNRKGDDVDPEKVERALRWYGSDTGNGKQRPGPPPHGQGNRQQTTFAPGERGLAEAKKRGYIKDA